VGMEMGSEVVGVDGAPGKLRRASAVPDASHPGT
jgi:hypothetical protein